MSKMTLRRRVYRLISNHDHTILHQDTFNALCDCWGQSQVFFKVAHDDEFCAKVSITTLPVAHTLGLFSDQLLHVGTNNTAKKKQEVYAFVSWFCRKIAEQYLISVDSFNMFATASLSNTSI